MESRVLIRDEVVPGDATPGAKIFSVRPGIDRFHWRDKAHTVN
ncbi:hypothetical protein BZ18_4320 (plasmid) [Yersinia pestis Pestoides F]|nr:hypothetical protein BZ18_4320 [Yersinia pestis Pestoides F]